MKANNLNYLHQNRQNNSHWTTAIACGSRLLHQMRNCSERWVNAFNMLTSSWLKRKNSESTSIILKKYAKTKKCLNARSTRKQITIPKLQQCFHLIHHSNSKCNPMAETSTIPMDCSVRQVLRDPIIIPCRPLHWATRDTWICIIWQSQDLNLEIRRHLK